MEREDFINKVLKSVDGIAKATPSDAIFLKIEKKIKETTISTKVLWLVAASIVVLISFNIMLLNGKSNSNESEIASLEHSINKSNQLYK
ncbi:hypothetical protein [Flavobacterium sp.]|uniref:hypothetical protein n=1 Tax=Flavobacterium sp. TaxID=239 RepID=UPI002629ACE8|nr:hypothetical protein [Flavobacterium sp.]